MRLDKFKLTGATAMWDGRAGIHAFNSLRRMLEVNQHFNGAAEMLARVEGALKCTTGLDLPLPRKLFQNPDSSLGVAWDGLFLMLTTKGIGWRFQAQGEPRYVGDADTHGPPLEIIEALAHLARMAAAN